MLRCKYIILIIGTPTSKDEINPIMSGSNNTPLLKGKLNTSNASANVEECSNPNAATAATAATAESTDTNACPSPSPSQLIKVGNCPSAPTRPRPRRRLNYL